MALTEDLIEEYVKVMTPKEEPKKESVIYGTVVKNGSKEYVRLDGAKPEMLTPVEKTTVVDNGDRVLVTIKNHVATITGNLSNPSASNGQVTQMGSKITEFEIVLADKVSTKELTAELAKIDTLITENFTATNAKIETLESETAKIGTIETDIIEVNKKLTAHSADITTLQADIGDFRNLTAQEIDAINGNYHTLSSDYATFKETYSTNLSATNADIEKLKADKLNADDAEITYAKIEALNATQAHVDDLKAEYATFSQTVTDKLAAEDAYIADLQAKKLDAESAKVMYANIDFTNIEIGAIKKLFSDSGIIKDITIQNGVITGELVGVTIKGNLIEGNTISADKLVVKGSDGLYYKLNIDGLNNVSTEQASKFVLLNSEPEDWATNYKDYYLVTNNNYVHVSGDTPPAWAANTYYKLSLAHESGLDGTNIIAKSITAEKIDVADLVAFGATIGGYEIRDHSIHTSTKESVNNTTRGVYMDDDGQFAIGDAYNFIKYYYDEVKKVYKLEMSAAVIKLGGSSKTLEQELDQITTDINNNKLENVRVGARNLILKSNYISLSQTDTPDAISISDNNNTEIIANGPFNIYKTNVDLAKSIPELCQLIGREYTFGCEIQTTNIGDKSVSVDFEFYNSADPTIKDIIGGRISKNNDGKILKVFGVGKITNTEHDACRIIISGLDCQGLILDYDNFMLEEGNIPSAWSPAPEDVSLEMGTKASQASLDEAKDILQQAIDMKADQESLDAAKENLNQTITGTKEELQSNIDQKADQDALESAADTLQKNIDEANLLIDSLEGMIQTLVVDEDGATMMENTGSGWKFNMGATRGALIKAIEDAVDAEKTARETKETETDNKINSLEDKTAYINMSTNSSGEPVIELGKSDSNFKIQISNNSIDFLDGNNRPCYINNNIFYGQNITVKNQLKIGNTTDNTGFYWKMRANGNLGLSYSAG